MKKLYIKRFKNIDDGTLGEFVLASDDKPILKGYTLEPAGADTIKANQDKRIPAGEYGATWSYSPKFNKKLPLLYNELVSKERRILIHSGNFADDTLGCVLVGSSYDDNGIYHSKETLNKLIGLAKDNDFIVVISNNKGV
ncbi:hypothetical protein CPIN18021_1093 [Campylobacter pinnipediorum subsp. caledonicus]|uniref:DUF5675 domain-containing protein n=2 Tax=Campylobacter TaxID=194 RepID=A0A1S6U899_9BACT|nr:hypothetical protein CPIN18020_0233 [Campylobacter pinnipediorum subsp. caledonicus]AQW87892.1 hypothetical protein CPIN18021_1093 [Campylobacter pinnipediorum subsp. caledonicus]